VLTPRAAVAPQYSTPCKPVRAPPSLKSQGPLGALPAATNVIPCGSFPGGSVVPFAARRLCARGCAACCVDSAAAALVGSPVRAAASFLFGGVSRVSSLCLRSSPSPLRASSARRSPRPFALACAAALQAPGLRRAAVLGCRPPGPLAGPRLFFCGSYIPSRARRKMLRRGVSGPRRAYGPPPAPLALPPLRSVCAQKVCAPGPGAASSLAPRLWSRNLSAPRGAAVPRAFLPTPAASASARRGSRPRPPSGRRARRCGLGPAPRLLRGACLRAKGRFRPAAATPGRRLPCPARRCGLPGGRPWPAPGAAARRPWVAGAPQGRPRKRGKGLAPPGRGRSRRKRRLLGASRPRPQAARVLRPLAFARCRGPQGSCPAV